jgi:MOSC domain-containing protein YiiM
LVLRAIVRNANQCLGLYASVVATGTVSRGDPVTLVDAAP